LFDAFFVINFNQANEKLENLTPEENFLLKEDKITIAIAISEELTKIENIINNLTRKQTRRDKDSQQFEEVFEKIKVLQKNKR